MFGGIAAKTFVARLGTPCKTDPQFVTGIRDRVGV